MLLKVRLLGHYWIRSHLRTNESDNCVSPEQISYLPPLHATPMIGHIVQPFYDPMLSKVVSYAPTRKQAIDMLSDGLDEYVIEGVQHNARLVSAVLRNAAFEQGQTPTSFLGKHFPEFNGAQLTRSEEEELAVAAAIVGDRRKQNRTVRSTSLEESRSVIVSLGGMFGSSYKVELASQSATVQCAKSPDFALDEPRTISVRPIEHDPQDYVVRITLDNIPRSLQVRAIVRPFDRYATPSYSINALIFDV